MFLHSPTVCDETGRGAGGWKIRRLVPHGVLPPALRATPLSEGGVCRAQTGAFKFLINGGRETYNIRVRLSVQDGSRRP